MKPEKKFNYVYKITNTINGKYYFGVHSTDDWNDGYMGSGTVLILAIRAHGKNSFEKEILFLFDTRKQALKKEVEVITIDHLLDAACYNLAQGGGTNNYIYQRKIEDYHAKINQPFDKEFEYIFSINTPHFEKWKQYIKSILSLPKKDQPKKQGCALTADRIMIARFDELVSTLGRFYNNLYNHDGAVEIIEIMKRKNLYDCLIIEKRERLVA